MKLVQRSVYGHVKRNLRPANQHAAKQFPFGIWTFPLSNISRRYLLVNSMSNTNRSQMYEKFEILIQNFP